MDRQTTIIETEVPQDIFLTLQASGLFREALAEQSRRLLAIHLYQDRTLSLGKAARLAGIGRWEFMELLAADGVPLIDYSNEELAAEFAAVERLSAEIHP